MALWQSLTALFFPRFEKTSTASPSNPIAEGAQGDEPLPVTPRIDSVLCLNSAGTHRMAYTEWGDPENPEVVLCVHGLTRTGRDFDALAAHLSSRFRVICPDVAGRGLSDWLPVKSEYGLPRYVSDMTMLIAKIAPQRLFWVGTSMGGLIGMTIAAQRTIPIEKLVLNDVGALLSRTALQRIGEYVGATPRFATFREAESYIRTICAPFGPLSAAAWRHLARHSVRQERDRSWVLHYDPGIAVPFRTAFPAQDLLLWDLYDAIPCPTLLLRGMESDLLSPEVARAMTERGPKAALVEFPGVGHAPSLMRREEITVVSDFLIADCR